MNKKIDSSIAISYYEGDTLITYTPSFDNEEKSMIKVKQAIMKLKVNILKENDEKFNIIYIEDQDIIESFKNVGSNGYLCFDITSRLQKVLDNSYNELILKIEGADESTINFFEEKEVLIEYNYKKEKRSDESNLKIDSKRVGKGNISLIKGNLELEHEDLVIDKNLSISIKHIYDSSDVGLKGDKIYKDTGDIELNNLNSYGKGWRINLEQYLVKEDNVENFNDIGNKYVYIDEEGKQEVFNERHYYL